MTKIMTHNFSKQCAHRNLDFWKTKKVFYNFWNSKNQKIEKEIFETFNILKKLVSNFLKWCFPKILAPKILGSIFSNFEISKKKGVQFLWFKKLSVNFLQLQQFKKFGLSFLTNNDIQKIEGKFFNIVCFSKNMINFLEFVDISKIWDWMLEKLLNLKNLF